MTTFAEMYDLVQNIVRRPEAQGVVESAIRTATLRAHHVDFFRRDLKVVDHGYTVINDAHFHDFENISDSLLPRMRAIKNVYSVSPDGHYQVEQLEYRESDDLYDADGMPRRIIYTVIGETLRCYFQLPTGRMHVYYWANPVVQSAGYSSWIADNYPEELAYWAAAIVFARSGFMDMAQVMQRDHINPFKEMLIASHLLGTVS